MCQSPTLFYLKFGARFYNFIGSRKAHTMALEKFTYKHDNKKIELPKFDQLPFGAIRKIRKEGEEEQFFLLIETVADEKSLGIIDTMSMEQISKLVTAWQKDGGVGLGESSD